MRRFIALIMTILTLTITTSTAYAADYATDIKIVEQKVLPYGIIEYIDENHQHFRVYKQDNNVSPNSIINGDYSEIKNVLLTLGMEQCFIDNLSQDDLETYAKSPQISATFSYTKTDSKGVTSYVDENVALSKSKEINAEKKQEILQMENNPSVSPMADFQYTKEDSYMRVWHGITLLGDGNYLSVTDARWLTMPVFRMKDSIGAAQQDCAIYYNSASGYYEYDLTQIVNGQVSHYYDTQRTISSSNFKNANDGTFYGYAAIVDLPDDVANTYTTQVYDDYKAHFQYNASIRNPGLLTRFNSTGTYDHLEAAVQINPTLEISYDDLIGIISLNTKLSHYPRTAPLIVTYPA